MSANNKNIRLVGILAVVIVAAGGIMTYLSKNAENKPAGNNSVMEQVSENTTTEQGDTDSTSEQVDPAEVATAAGGQSASSEIKVEPGNPVVARVDGKDITRVDVYRYIKTMPQNLQQLPASTVYPLALEQVINTRLVQNKAEEADIANSDQMKHEMEMARQQILRNIYLQEQVDSKINDSDLQKSYKEYTSKIPDVKQRRASHILLETEEKAKEIIKKLDDGADFAALAKESSTGPTGPKGGDLGYFAKEEMVPEFATAAFELKKGEVTKAPVKTQFGYHVIKVTDERTQPKPTFEEMKPMLQAEKRREVLENLLEGWRKNTKIEQFDINGKPLKKENSEG